MYRGPSPPNVGSGVEEDQKKDRKDTKSRSNLSAAKAGNRWFSSVQGLNGLLSKFLRLTVIITVLIGSYQSTSSLVRKRYIFFLTALYEE